MYLRDRVNATPSHGQHNGNGKQGNATGTSQRKLCFDFNRGECTFGQHCHFDHHCSFCNKFGHSAMTCRKGKKNNSSSGNNNNNNNNNNNQGGTGNSANTLVHTNGNK